MDIITLDAAGSDRKGGIDYELTLSQLRCYRYLRYRNMDRRTRELMKQLIFRLMEDGRITRDEAGEKVERIERDKSPLTAADIYMTLDLSDQMFYTKNIVVSWMESAKMPLQLALVARMDAALLMMDESGFGDESGLLRERYMELPERPVREVTRRLGYSSINAYYKAHESAVSHMSLYLHDSRMALGGDIPPSDRERIESIIGHFEKAAEEAFMLI